jgi:hypothetical protein
MRTSLVLFSLWFSASARAEDWRPYVFSVAGDTLLAKHAVLESGVGYNGVTGTGGGLSPDSAHRIQFWLASSVGITNWLTFDGGLQFADNIGQNFGFSQARLDLRARLFKKGPFAMSLGVGYQADQLLQNAVTAVAAVTATFGRFDLTLNVRAAHYFHSGRDPVDLFVTFGALVRTTRWLHLGVEYVGEELEAAFDEEGEVEAPGFGRHYLGPTAALRFWDGRIRVNATVGAVMTQKETGPLARGSFAYLF